MRNFCMLNSACCFCNRTSTALLRSVENTWEVLQKCNFKKLKIILEYWEIFQIISGRTFLKNTEKLVNIIRVSQSADNKVRELLSDERKTWTRTKFAKKRKI